MAAEDLTQCLRGRALKLPKGISGLNDGLGDGDAVVVGNVDSEVGFVAHGITSRD